MVIINVTTAPQRYTYRPGMFGFYVYEGENVIAATNTEVYAKAITHALNSWYAILCHMPIKLGRSDARN